MLRTVFLSTDAREGQATAAHVILKQAAARSRQRLLPWTYQIQRQDSTDKTLVTLQIHHALYDATSIGILTEQLNHLCAGASPLRQNGNILSFVDATTMLNAEAKKRQKEVWTTYLDPRGLVNPQSVTRFGRQRLERFEPSLLATRSLRSQLRIEGISLQALFFAVVGQVYYSHLQKDKSSRVRAAERQAGNAVVIGVYLSLRNLDVPDLPSLAAPTVNIVPLRVAIEQNVWDVARQVQRDLALIGREENCGVSLREIWDWSDGKVRLGCVVNFLADIDGALGNAESRGDQGDKTVWHASNAVIQSFGASSQMDDQMAAHSPFIVDNETRKSQELPWCIPSIDIEAKTIRSENGNEENLAVGVFGQEDIMGGIYGMEVWLRGVRDLLRGLTEEDRRA